MSSNVLFLASHLLFPEVIVNYFDLKIHESKGAELHFYFTESNVVPEEYKEDNLNSKGFFLEATVQNFPIHGKNIFFNIRQCR